jgi:hypothetical protein
MRVVHVILGIRHNPLHGQTKRCAGKLNVKASTFDDSLLDKTFPELHNEEEDRLRIYMSVVVHHVKKDTDLLV